MTKTDNSKQKLEISDDEEIIDLFSTTIKLNRNELFIDLFGW